MTAVLPTGLFVAALGLVVVVGYQALAPVAPIEAEAVHETAPPPAPPAALPAYRPPSEAQFEIINMRPLFDPARRPVMEPAPSGPRSLLPPQLSLVGVAIGAQRSVALLKKTGAAAAISAQLGQGIDGWRLVRIEPGFVILRSGATDYTVKLRAAAGLPQPMVNDTSPPGTTNRRGR